MNRTGLIIFVVGFVAFLSVGYAQPVEDQPLEKENNSNAKQDTDESRSGGRAKAYVLTGSPQYQSAPGQGSLYPSQGGQYQVQGGQGAYFATTCHDCADCPEVYQNTTVKSCSVFDPSKKNRCVTYTEKYQNMKTPWVVRGCVSDRGSCAEIQQSHQADYVKLVSCYECTGDKCNGVARELPSFIIGVITLLVTPLVAKKVLS